MPAQRLAPRTVPTVTAAAVGMVLAVLATLSGCGSSQATERMAINRFYPEVSTTATPVLESPTPLVTPTPSPSVSATPTPTPKVTPKPTTSTSACPQTSRQKAVETALRAIGTYGAIVLDGYQSAVDCATIKRFQKRMGIVPASGSASATTLDVARRIAATNPAQCNAGTATMACIDLTHQSFYVMQGGKVVVGPTVTRTGKPGYATPAGTFKIFERSKNRWSSIFHVWMPFWQQFHNGMGLHETTTYIHNMPIGSHGCVNLLHADAVAAYGLLTYGSKVRTYGRRPGT
jgi:lipoprotein-anchoring transpeptidase ErfK/SrfK